MRQGPLMLAGGGTGGHLFPGLAVAEVWRRRHPDRGAVVVGTGKAVERRAVKASGCDLELIAARPLRGRDVRDQALSLASIPLAMGQTAALLVRRRPAAVVGLGGYASGPVVLTAAMARFPTAVMEQNSVPGSTNRLLARLRAIDRTYLTYPSSRRFFSWEMSRVVGNPIRGAVLEAQGAPLPPAPTSVLVLGGSQGAQRLNYSVPDALAAAGAAERGLKIVHGTGDAMAEAVRRRYDELGLPARVEPFIDDMASAYEGATLVISRAGATTLSELCVVGRPSVLIPFPHAIDDHQYKNARELESAGAAVVIRDDVASAEALAPILTELLDDPERLAGMAARSAAAGVADAAERVVEDLEELIDVQR